MKVAEKILTAAAGIIFLSGLITWFLFKDIKYSISTFFMAAASLVIQLIIRLKTHHKDQERRSSTRSVSAAYRIDFDRMSTDRWNTILEDLKQKLFIVTATPNNAMNYYYSINANGRQYYVSLFSQIDTDMGEGVNEQERRDNQVFFTGLQMTYSNKRIEMDSSEFSRNMNSFVNLCEKIEQRLLPPSNGLLEITIWQFIRADTIFKIEFKKHLNNIFKSQYFHQITLKSKQEQCTIGKDHAVFRIPLKAASSIIPSIAQIIW